MSGNLSADTVVGGNVYSDGTGIEVYGNITAYNTGMMIGGVISPDIKLIDDITPDNGNAYKGIDVGMI